MDKKNLINTEPQKVIDVDEEKSISKRDKFKKNFCRFILVLFTFVIIFETNYIYKYNSINSSLNTKVKELSKNDYISTLKNSINTYFSNITITYNDKKYTLLPTPTNITKDIISKGEINENFSVIENKNTVFTTCSSVVLTSKDSNAKIDEEKTRINLFQSLVSSFYIDYVQNQKGKKIDTTKSPLKIKSTSTENSITSTITSDFYKETKVKISILKNNTYEITIN